MIFCPSMTEYSKRIQHLLQTPLSYREMSQWLYLGQEWVKLTLMDEMYFAFILDHSRIQQTAFAGQFHPLTQALLEATFQIIQGRDLSSLQLLEYREIENYLRDENHVPSFHSEVVTGELFKQLLNELFFSLVFKKMNFPNEDLEFLPSKIRLIDSFFTQLAQFSQSKIDLKLVEFYSPEIVVRGKWGDSKDVLEGALSELLNEQLILVAEGD